MSPFGAERDGGARSHQGIDIEAPAGSQIVAAASGRVFKAGQISATAGLGVEIDHGSGYITKYFHASRVLVQVGQKVSAGQAIALVGNTGNAATTPSHLHFEVWASGRAIDPLTVVPLAPLNGSSRTVLFVLVLFLIARRIR